MLKQGRAGQPAQRQAPHRYFTFGAAGGMRWPQPAQANRSDRDRWFSPAACMNAAE